MFPCLPRSFLIVVPRLILMGVVVIIGILGIPLYDVCLHKNVESLVVVEIADLYKRNRSAFVISLILSSRKSCYVSFEIT